MRVEREKWREESGKLKAESGERRVEIGERVESRKYVPMAENKIAPRKR